MAAQLKSKFGKISKARIYVDDKLITSREPEAAFEFAFAIVKNLDDEKKVTEVAGPMRVK